METSQLLREFRIYLEENKRRSPTTVRGYVRNAADILEADSFGSVDRILEKLAERVQSIGTWDDSRETTQRRKISAANAFLKFLSKYHSIKYSPFPIEKNPEGQYKTITNEQFQRILTKIPTEDLMALIDKTAYFLMFNLGLRVSEVSSLTSENIGVGNGKDYLHINSGLLHQRRLLKIDPQTQEAIKNYTEMYSQQRKPEMPTVEQGTFLKNRFGKKVSTRNVTSSVP